MKAWIVHDYDNYYATVVFADTRNKAKVEALATDCCEDMEYKDIRPRRFKEADCRYNGKRELDWSDDSDRLFLIQNGWRCEDPDQDQCERCVCKAECEQYKEMQE